MLLQEEPHFVRLSTIYRSNLGTVRNGREWIGLAGVKMIGEPKIHLYLPLLPLPGQTLRKILVLGHARLQFLHCRRDIHGKAKKCPIIPPLPALGYQGLADVLEMAEWVALRLALWHRAEAWLSAKWEYATVSLPVHATKAIIDQWGVEE
jgi:hypothetical protein